MYALQNDLRDRQRRKFLQLQFHHLFDFGNVAGWELHGAQENAVGRKDGDVQLGPEQRFPILGGHSRRQRIAGQQGLLPLHHKPIAAGVQPP